MRAHDIAIVGGYGEVGVHTARYLVEQGHRVVVGGRAPDRGREVLARANLPVPVERVDWSEPSSLARFCSSARIVINTAGPSSAIGDRIARCALDCGSHFIDVGIMEVLDKSMQRASEELQAKGLACIYGTGLHPGLDDIFALYADQDAARELDGFDSLEVFFGDKSPWNGKGSLRDIVWGMHEGAMSLYFGFLKNGQYQKANLFNGFKRVHFEEVDRLRWALMFQPLLSHLGARYPFLASWGWFDFDIILAGLWTKLRFEPGSEAAVDYMYRKIVERNRAYQHMATDTFLYTIVKGRRGDRERELEYRLVLPRDRGYWAVGIVPAITAHWLLSGQLAFRGAGGLGNIVDVGAFMREVARFGVTIACRERGVQTSLAASARN